MGVLTRIFGGRGGERAALVPLYHAIVAEARRPAWYREAAVADTIDGRFDVLALAMSLVLLRLEREGAAGAQHAVLLTEVFIDDMDGTMREIGYGDLVVGKQVGGAMGALGGRLGAYREGERRAALARNLYRGHPPDERALDRAVVLAEALEARIEALPLDRLLAGALA